MSFVFLLIFIIILAIDFKKGVLIYAPFKFYFYSGYGLVGIYDFDMVLSFIIVGVYFLRGGRLGKYPWLGAILIASLGNLIYDFNPKFSIPMILYNIVSIYAYAYVYYDIIKTRKDFNFALGAFSFFILLLTLNGIIQFMTNINALGDFHDANMRKDIFLADNFSMRGDKVRIRSFMPHSIGFGVICVVGSYLYAVLLAYYRAYFKKYMYLLFGLCFIGCFISVSRTPLLGLCILSLPIVFKFLKTSDTTRLTLIIVVSLFLVFGFDYIYNMLSSLGDKGSKAHGSSMEMRIMQFTIAFSVMAKKFWLGMGHTYNIFVNGRKLFGAESCWLPIIMKQGFIGVTCYALYYYKLFRESRIFNRKIIIYFFIFSYLVMDSATNLPGITNFFPLMILTFLAKLDLGFTDSKLVLSH